MRRTTWPGTIIDAGDGSGDFIVELPDELCEQLGWKIDDKIDVSIGPRNEIILKKRHTNILWRNLKFLISAWTNFFNKDKHP